MTQGVSKQQNAAMHVISSVGAAPCGRPNVWTGSSGPLCHPCPSAPLRACDGHPHGGAPTRESEGSEARAFCRTSLSLPHTLHPEETRFRVGVAQCGHPFPRPGPSTSLRISDGRPHWAAPTPDRRPGYSRCPYPSAYGALPWAQLPCPLGALAHVLHNAPCVKCVVNSAHEEGRWPGGQGGSFGSISVSRLRSFMFFSAVALFLCIPPLILAEDALPKEIIEKRQMEEHLKRARERMMKS